MPYTPTVEPKANGEIADEAASDRPRDQALNLRTQHDQEFQVRQTVQRILAAHLLPPAEPTDPALHDPRPPHVDPYWPNLLLDFTGATLVDFDFSATSVAHACFNCATFIGHTNFTNATFTGVAGFYDATFTS
jgi:hypothetical protein